MKHLGFAMSALSLMLSDECLVVGVEGKGVRLWGSPGVPSSCSCPSLPRWQT